MSMIFCEDFWENLLRIFENLENAHLEHLPNCIEHLPIETQSSDEDSGKKRFSLFPALSHQGAFLLPEGGSISVPAKKPCSLVPALSHRETGFFCGKLEDAHPEFQNAQGEHLQK